MVNKIIRIDLLRYYGLQTYYYGVLRLHID